MFLSDLFLMIDIIQHYFIHISSSEHRTLHERWSRTNGKFTPKLHDHDQNLCLVQHVFTPTPWHWFSIFTGFTFLFWLTVFPHILNAAYRLKRSRDVLLTVEDGGRWRPAGAARMWWWSFGMPRYLCLRAQVWKSDWQVNRWTGEQVKRLWQSETVSG